MINEKQLKRYCSEDISKIENYEQAVNDKTQTWHCHHRLEIQGQFRNSTSLLKNCGLYYHVPAWQLIFLTNSEHRRLHNIGNIYGIGNKGKCLSDETRKKLSMSLSGEKNPMFGKCGEKSHMFGKHLSIETRKKLSMLHIGKCHSAESIKKMSDMKIGRKWFTNGIDEICQYECPGKGWVIGRLKRNKCK